MVEPTHLQNMFVKFHHPPIFLGKHTCFLKPPRLGGKIRATLRSSFLWKGGKDDFNFYLYKEKHIHFSQSPITKMSVCYSTTKQPASLEALPTIHSIKCAMVKRRYFGDKLIPPLMTESL